MKNSDIKLLIACVQFTHAGGIERYSRDLVSGFASLYSDNQSKKNIYILYQQIDQSLPELSKATPLRSKIHFLPKKIRNFLFSNEIKKTKKREDIDLSISCHSLSAADILVCGFTRRGEAADQTTSKTFSYMTKSWLEQKSFDNSQLIIAHSKKIKNELIQYYAQAANKIKLLYPPVNETEFYPVTEEERKKIKEKFNFPNDRVVFVFPSTGHTRKGLKTLLEWFAQTDLPITLYVAGNSIGQQIKNVEYLGYRKDMADIYRAVDFSILNSVYEPFGLVGVESVLCGTPTLQSTNSGCTEVLSDDACLKFEPDNIKQIDACIRQAVSLRLTNRSRLKDPYSHILYDPSLETHIKEIIRLSQQLT